MRGIFVSSVLFIRKVPLSFSQLLRTILFPLICRWLLPTVANSRAYSGLTWTFARNLSFLKHIVFYLGGILNRQTQWCWYKQKKFYSEVTDSALFSDHFKSWICLWTEISKAKFVWEIQSSELFWGGVFFIRNTYVLENTPHEKLLLSVRGFKGKIISFIFFTGKALSLSFSLSLFLINS